MTQGSQHTKGDSAPKRDHAKKNATTKVLYVKTAFALVWGIGLGVLKVTGPLGLIAFFPIQYFLAQLYCSHYKVPDYLMDRLDILIEQFIPSFGLFLVTWIFTYTAIHW